MIRCRLLASVEGGGIGIKGSDNGAFFRKLGMFCDDLRRDFSQDVMGHGISFWRLKGLV